MPEASVPGEGPGFLDRMASLSTTLVKLRTRELRLLRGTGGGQIGSPRDETLWLS